MQKDMHYYAVYVLARAAGVNPDAARTIATSSQFVDDCPENFTVKLQGGGSFDVVATAHHFYSFSNFSRADQVLVWVPFHFIPGNEGADYTERLVCRKDSVIARAMFEQALKGIPSKQGVHRLGIAAHAYADTFSHYGFSGVCSRCNDVDNDSIKFNMTLDPEIEQYIRGKAKQFFEKFTHEVKGLANIKSWILETVSGALGHAAVATYPDRPYLIWSFDYEHPAPHPSGERNNQATYLDFCERLHGLFANAVKMYPNIGSGPSVSFQRIRSQISDILKTQEKQEGRIDLWLNAAKEGRILPDNNFDIPEYNGELWLKAGKDLDKNDEAAPGVTQELRLFSQAAIEHREFMLKTLLPSNGIDIT